MIRTLVDQRLLSVVRSRSGTTGYRFAGQLHEALELLDACLMRLFAAGVATTTHSCTTLFEPQLLQRIGYLERLPSIPFYATPHGVEPASGGDAEWVLSPSACYSTFAHLEETADAWRLRAFTTRGHCHRHEASDGEPTRMSMFEMRELVLVGDPEEVVRQADESFARVLTFLRKLGAEVSVARANDVFYGERAHAARRVQYALGVKEEARLPWSDSVSVAVGSRNLHRDLFTNAFSIGPREPTSVMHSTCVAFGLERLLLTLLAAQPTPDPARLLARVAAAEEAAVEAT